MARKQTRPSITEHRTLEPLQITCRACGSRMRMGHHSHRTVTTLEGVIRLTLKVYRCRNTACPRFHQATRPEEEGAWALPHGEFGLNVIALVGVLRYQQQRSIPQIHEELLRRGLLVAQRTVTDQLYRYEELLTLHLADPSRLQERLRGQKQVILGDPRLLLSRGAGGPESVGSDGERSGAAAWGSSEPLPQAGHSHRRRDHRWTALHPQRGGTGLADYSPPIMPVSLSA
jgi:hypothetical protein